MDQKRRLLNYTMVFIFLVLIIINSILLIQNINKFIKKLSNIDNFVKEKLNISKNKFITNIIGIIIVFHYLSMGFLLSFKNDNPSPNFGFFIYIYINKAILDLVFWII